jgi:hypothetical protein
MAVTRVWDGAVTETVREPVVGVMGEKGEGVVVGAGVASGVMCWTVLEGAEVVDRDVEGGSGIEGTNSKVETMFVRAMAANTSEHAVELPKPL